MSGRM